MNKLHPCKKRADRRIMDGMKRSFSLIEVMVSLALAALLIGGLFELQRGLARVEQRVDGMRKIALERERFYLRLKAIFFQLESCETSDAGIVLRYTNFVDPDKRFRGPLVSLLHVSEGRVVLTTWPKKGEPRQEVVLGCDRQESLSCLFLDEETGTWTATNSGKGLTPMVKLAIGKVEFPFWVKI